jgi:hypothetical protein
MTEGGSGIQYPKSEYEKIQKVEPVASAFEVVKRTVDEFHEGMDTLPHTYMSRNKKAIGHLSMGQYGEALTQLATDWIQIQDETLKNPMNQLNIDLRRKALHEAIDRFNAAKNKSETLHNVPNITLEQIKGNPREYTYEELANAYDTAATVGAITGATIPRTRGFNNFFQWVQNNYPTHWTNINAFLTAHPEIMRSLSFTVTATGLALSALGYYANANANHFHRGSLYLGLGAYATRKWKNVVGEIGRGFGV